MTVSLAVRPGRDPAAVERLLRELPEWFGIESSIVEYVYAAGRLPTLLALTRRFYAAMGYQPVEELRDLWPGNPCLLMVKPLTR